MKTNKIDDIRQWVKDLRQEEPRDSSAELGGFEGAARVIDKCRASLLGLEGEYQFGCPSDQTFARSNGIDLDDLKDIVATGASDEDVAEWLRLNTRPSTRH